MIKPAVLPGDAAADMPESTGGRSPLWRNRLGRFVPGAGDYPDLRRVWRADLVAGATVGIVALPLALAFGITTGLGARAGLVTAIVAGLVAAVFGGSDVQVSGPTGAMTVVLVPVVHHYGPSAVVTVGVLAGALVVIAGLVRAGRYLAYVPWPVIEGFTVGIAVIIFLQQVPNALGVPKPSTDRALGAAITAIGNISNGSVAAIGITVLVAVIMVVTPHVRRSLPASLVAIVIATAVADAAHLSVARIGALPSSLPGPSLPDLSITAARPLLGAAIAVAALAALESLLSARVADGMADGRRHDPDRELFGQGLANIVAPLFGGMPATGAIARTAVNVRAGARTRLAAMSHALVLVAVVYLGASTVSRIPLAALAGVLMVTAVRMVEIANVRSVLRATRSDAVVLTLTAGATVVFDLITAVELGIAVAAVLALRKVALAASATAEPLTRPTDVEVDPDDETDLLHHHIVAYRLDGALFFGAAQRFLAELTAVADVRVVILRLPQLQVLDATGAQALGAIVAELEHRGITVLLKGPSPEHLATLEAVGALEHLAHHNHIFETLPDAIAHAHTHLDRAGTP